MTKLLKGSVRMDMFFPPLLLAGMAGKIINALAGVNGKDFRRDKSP